MHVTLHMALARCVFASNCDAIVAKAHLADKVMRMGRDSKRASRFTGGTAPPSEGRASALPRSIRTPAKRDFSATRSARSSAPAVERGAAEGLDVTGPLPTDTLMVRARDGEFDAVVAMYHDQGHIALKLLGISRAVNVTLGLPIVRTSVAHGTAFDIAWQGVAETSSMIEAIRVAARLAAERIARIVTRPPIPDCRDCFGINRSRGHDVDLPVATSPTRKRGSPR